MWCQLQIIEKLSVRAPSGEVKLKLLKEIAAEHSVSWDSADTEAELTKSHEDLLVSLRTHCLILFPTLSLSSHCLYCVVGPVTINK